MFKELRSLDPTFQIVFVETGFPLGIPGQEIWGPSYVWEELAPQEREPAWVQAPRIPKCYADRARAAGS